MPLRRSRSLCRLAGALAAPPLLSLVLADRGDAHAVPHPRRAQVVLDMGGIHVRLHHDLEGAEAESARARFDRDADGRLDEAERDAALRFLAHRARHRLRISVDGERLNLTVTGRSGDGFDEPVASTDHLGVTVLLDAALPAGAPSYRVAIEELDTAGDRPLALEILLGDGVALAGVDPSHLTPGGEPRTDAADRPPFRLRPGEAWSATVTGATAAAVPPDRAAPLR